MSRRITAAVVPTLYRPRVSGGGGVRVGTEFVCTRLARARSLSCSVSISPSHSLVPSLSLSAGKVDLSGGRSYYLLFSPSTVRGRFHPVKPSTKGILSTSAPRRPTSWSLPPEGDLTLSFLSSFFLSLSLLLLAPDARTLRNRVSYPSERLCLLSPVSPLLAEVTA